jgi:hypothetical protein
MPDLISTGLKLFFAYNALKERQRANSVMSAPRTYQTVTDKDTALLEVKGKAGSVAVIVGTRDTGKTVVSRRLAQFYGRPVYIVSPQQAAPSWMTPITFQEIEERVPENCTLILEDLPSYASNRQYNNETVQTLERIVPMVRHDRHPPDFPVGKVHLIIITQSTAQADKYVLDCDLALFKPLGLLNEERPNVARIYKNFVNPEFVGKDSMWIKTHAYLMTPTWRGIIEISNVN